MKGRRREPQLRVAEKTKKASADEAVDFESLGIHEGEPASLEQVEQLFEQNPQLIDGMKRNFHHLLRQAIEADYTQRHSSWKPEYSVAHYPASAGPFHVTSFTDNAQWYPPWQKKENEPSERITTMGEEGDQRYGAEFFLDLDSSESGSIRKDKLVFLFSTDKEEAKALFDWPNYFRPTHDYRFDGMYYLPAKSSREKPKKIPLREAIESGIAGEIDYDRLKNVVESIIPMPDADVSRAIEDLEKLTAAENVDEQELEKMKAAIVEFATFVKPEPLTGDQCFREIGRCLTAPGTFIIYMRERHDMDDIDRDHYGSALGSYHEVNRWGNICIDWTAKQFNELREKPYPYIYMADDPHHLGKLYSRWTEEEKRETEKYERLSAMGIEY
ncbi:MAG: hypothetical protein ABIG66_02670 [Candidatus Kerfeldbacteria bacterium]